MIKNEPAFPHHIVCDKGFSEPIAEQGMTLRDYFAAKAMQATLSNIEWMKTLAKSNDNLGGSLLVAVSAYEVADAMLRAREEMPLTEYED